jgi:hypothetical protein
MSPLNFDQSSTNNREMLDNSQEGLMIQEGNSMNSATNQIELHKSN